MWKRYESTTMGFTSGGELSVMPLVVLLLIVVMGTAPIPRYPLK
jgi:hypothetical protein